MPTSNDGKLTHFELVKHLNPLLRGDRDDVLRLFFDLYKIDGDGKLSAAEIISVYSDMIAVNDHDELQTLTAEEKKCNKLGPAILWVLFRLVWRINSLIGACLSCFLGWLCHSGPLESRICTRLVRVHVYCHLVWFWRYRCISQHSTHCRSVSSRYWIWYLLNLWEFDSHSCFNHWRELDGTREWLQQDTVVLCWTS